MLTDKNPKNTLKTYIRLEIQPLIAYGSMDFENN